MNKIKVIPFALVTVGAIYLLSFKNPLKTEVMRRLDDDSTFYKLPEDQKRLPENAMAGLIVSDSLSVNLFASEPTIKNPTNIDIDSKGRVWLCEGYNYRPQFSKDKTINPEGDRIVILEDTDGDGKSDKTKVFYQGMDVNAALGILVLGNKVIVSCSPNILVLTDENGDDKSDKKEILFQGISGEQHDHGVHAFIFGPDGKLYFNFGNAGGELKDKNGNFVKDKYGNEISYKNKAIKQGMVFRCNLDGSEVELLGFNFRNNYEISVDSYGTLWQSDNDDDGNKAVRINYVMEYGNYGYTDEMTGAGWSSRRTNMEKEIPARHWHLNDPGVVPNLLLTGSGSPTGMFVYEGNLLPNVYRNQMMHCDAGPKVVRSYPVTKDGAGYKASMVNVVQGRDDWFRPSDVCAAPDGSVFISDWYDAGVGGHQRADIVKGRIYRVSVKGNNTYKVAPVKFDTPEDAAEALKSPNMSTRYMAWEKLKSFGAKAEKPLNKLLASNNPRFRARALWFLAKMEGKSKKYLTKAFEDKDEDIRITGIRIARQTESDLMPYLKKLSNDNSIQVKRELAIALRNVPATTESSNLWADLALKYDGKDRWYLEALGIGASTHWKEFFAAWKNKVGDNWNTPAGKDIIWRARNAEALPLLAKIISDPSTLNEDEAKYFRAFDFQKDSLVKRTELLRLLSIKGKNEETIKGMAILGLSASDLVGSPELKKALYERLDKVKGTWEYLDLVSKFQLKDQEEALYHLVNDDPDFYIRLEAAKVLAQLNGMGRFEKVMKGKNEDEKLKLIASITQIENLEFFAFKKAIVLDATQSSNVRKNAVKSIGFGWWGEEVLLAWIKEGKVPAEYKTAAGEVLFQAYRGEIREEAAKYIKPPVAAEGKPLSPVRDLINQKGDVVNGAKMYSRYCIGCHVVNGKGIDFGPQLSEIGSKLGKDGLYTAIITPDAGISFGYEGYIIKQKNGGGGNGIIVSKTENEIELKTMGGSITKIKIADIADKKEMDKSLMPSNLYASMSEQQFVDLVEYLSSLKKPN